MTALLIEAIQARVESLAGANASSGRLLQGLAGVMVVDVRVSPLVATQGLSAADLRALLARELLGAGIPMPAPRNGHALGGLVASVDGLQAGDGTWAVCVLLELQQRARLSRDSGAAFDATTWSGKLPALSSSSELESCCRNLFRQLTLELATVLRDERHVHGAG